MELIEMKHQYQHHQHRSHIPGNLRNTLSRLHQLINQKKNNEPFLTAILLIAMFIMRT